MRTTVEVTDEEIRALEKLGTFGGAVSLRPPERATLVALGERAKVLRDEQRTEKAEVEKFDRAMEHAITLLRGVAVNETVFSVKFSDDEAGVYEIAFEEVLVRATQDGAEIIERVAS